MFENSDAGFGNLGANPIAGQYGNQGVQVRFSSKCRMSAACFCRNPN